MPGPGVIATLALASLVIPFFYTSKFLGAVGILRWICLGTTMQVISWPLGFIIVAKNDKILFVGSDLLWALVHIGLAWSCIRLFGLDGSGLAFFGAYIFHFVLIYVIVRHRTGFRWSLENLQLFAVFTPMTLAAFCASYWLPPLAGACVGTILTISSGFYSLRILNSIASVDLIPLRFRKLLAPLAFLVGGPSSPRNRRLTAMPNPTVSFVVPCYRLGHLLAECVNSILAQTYADFEILIMDDASPDDTGTIATSFHDSRVKYVRNPQNLGALRDSATRGSPRAEDGISG